MEKSEKTLLKMENINIEFPGVKALTDVHFEMETGSIRALIGANGAGKSTLMKVLSGAYNHYTGKISFNNEEVIIKTPKDGKDLGIDIVYQEVDTALIPHLTVGENIMLDMIVNDMGKRQIINWRNIHYEANKVLERLNIKIDTKKIVSQLDLADKQMILIARSIVKERKFLILDEPTAPLSNRETKELFRIIKDLAGNQNIGVIFISHRLPELFEICEDITIMKDGKVVTSQPISDLTTQQVVELMLGKTFEEEFTRADRQIGNETIFEINSLNDKEGKVNDVSLHVRKGEIVGIAGLVGAGKTELCKTIFGAHQIDSGAVKLYGKSLNIRSPHHAVIQGLALVPEERRKEGVLVDESVYMNLTAASLNKYTTATGVLQPKLERNTARKMIGSLGIKTPNERQKVSLLSGGNQQKVAVGKWLLSNAEIYIFDEPTKGVDVGAKKEIFDLIGDLANDQKGVIYASSELSEIMAITDRIYVMYDNRVVKELVTRETTEEEVMYFSTGGN
ncbi:sugar ABC transporter ATP-binding protein [Siminovitchia fortis]|uniref:Sugar ABC transporter ATP-binding protein n=1 Tax=Siminovitchia fortis TaxID=254758 RepID=A0A443J0H8_9BACI|nr:sugar ABC transporter ATP-binding protein [Siminovitchia fortis]RWR13954.1 sugar ABC transporter ATP-binding protein [Siminovitchia fortis]WHY81197.1 sugar ABC transporter ATP-binding protein [Siminovitchia fortis]